MGKTWNGKSYDMDWYEIDASGARTTGEKDWQANREWDQANDPAGAWNFSPEVKAANPVQWDQTAIGQQQRNDKAPVPVMPGAPATGRQTTPATPFQWDNPGDFSTPSANTGGTRQPPQEWNAATNEFSYGSWNAQQNAKQGMAANPGAPGNPSGPGQVPVGGATGGFNIPAGDPRSQADFQAEYDRGTAAGRDMSWMRQPGGGQRTDLTPPSQNLPMSQIGSLPSGQPPKGALEVQAPNMDAAALMSQLQGPANLGQVQGPAALGQVQGPAALGQVQGPAALGQMQGPAALGALQGPAAVGQIQGPAALGALQGPAALQQLGNAPTVAQGGPMSGFGQNVQGSIQRGLSDPTVDTNSPAYQQQIAAFQRNAQRAADRTRAANAQRANAQGTLGSGSFDASVNRVLQNQGAAEQDFEAQLMQSELNAGRERQARAQQLGAGLLSQEQQQSLTERLANQSSALQGMGLNNQRDLANQNTAMQTLGLNSGRDQASLQAQLAAMGINSQRDLANQSTAMQTLGLNSGRDQSNVQAALAAMGINSQRDLANNSNALAALGLNNQRDLANSSNAMATLGLNSQRDQSNVQAQLAALGLNNQRDLSNQASQLQTLGLNNQRDLTSYGAQNQRDLASYGGQLQTNLANQDARLRQRGYNLQKYLGGRDLDLRGQQMNNQNQQFYDQLGQQLGLETGRMNQQALLALLGGG